MIRQLAESTDCQHWRPPSVPVLTSRGGSRLRYGGGGRWRVLHAVSFCWGNATGRGRREGGLCRKSTVLVGRDWIRTGKFFLKIFPWSKMHQWGTLSEQKSVIYCNWCIWLWAGMHFLGDHLRDQDTQQSLNCKLKNKKSIITVTGCSWWDTANSLQNMILLIGSYDSVVLWFTDSVVIFCLLTCEVETMVWHLVSDWGLWLWYSSMTRVYDEGDGLLSLHLLQTNINRWQLTGQVLSSLR